MNFILVDDDPINNTLCRAVISKIFVNADIKAFEFPDEALAFIQKEYLEKENSSPVILFLDINMPAMTGWEFMEEFKTFPDEIKKQFKIFMLSSSVDSKDIERADKNELIAAYIPKPLKRDLLKSLFPGIA